MSKYFEVVRPRVTISGGSFSFMTGSPGPHLTGKMDPVGGGGGGEGGDYRMTHFTLTLGL